MPAVGVGLEHPRAAGRLRHHHRLVDRALVVRPRADLPLQPRHQLRAGRPRRGAREPRASGLVAARTWSFWVALPLALVGAVVLGSVIERVVIRRFAKAPRLILMVVTIGLAQFFAGHAVRPCPFWLGEPDRPPAAAPAAVRLQLRDGHPIIFHANELIAVIVTVRRDRRACSRSSASRASASRSVRARRARTGRRCSA